MSYAHKHRTHTEETLRLFAAVCGTVLLAVAVFFAMRGTLSMYGKLSAASESSSAAERELQDLEARQTRIQADIERLSSSRGVEGELRQRYGLAKPGEGVIQVVESQSTPVPAGAKNENPIQNMLKTLFPW